ncbi:uncharacterized protein LOC124369204 [Homalodisca vitripennis]|uniref:uncharacterized protein LOC124369204 n=1 Tax=Homalodisca vitripennis TaxID=197043 RepID=UPI001EEAFD65|nr:uncharacterized protein LOC124369204 [Homalodisca vitripennis]
MAVRLSLLLLCALALFVAVQSRTVRERRSPDSSEEHSWTDAFKNTFQKAKDGISETVDNVKNSDAYERVKDGINTAGDKISEIGHNIKNSDAYERVSSEIHNAGEKLSQLGDNIKDSDTVQGVKSTISKAADNIKDKLDD